MRTGLATICLILSMTMSVVFAQAAEDVRLEKARALEADREFKAALKLYEKIHKDDPSNNALIYKIGGLAYNLGDYKRAAKYYEKLAPNGNPTVLYNLACSYSLAGKESKALDALEQSVNKGFNQLALIKSDKDLERLRETQRFAEILASVKAVENIPEAQKFDFWVGEWRVTNPQGIHVGDSKIEKILGGNVILENWFGSSGSQGKSFNHYHMESGKWIQYWVDQSSDRIYFEGNYDAEQQAIVFHERVEQADKPLRRLTFFDLSPDTVRQFSELSNDAGQSWSTEYDFLYVRK